ncbi:low molecular weight protein-tyrosine-phosphatase [Alkalicoccus halolimnae]|uniref:protein-tyrosine-phosphatase n=1 Tax=Alkalicoccus halolimnae TaxID=1667239 RepID=A0A5C7F4N2_9BACI|nr:low molecular weight protein-tyrosine-phosphatase [Alkalicoccus halolimnae]TXF83076.1 low molecular weight phosphotyrosine protein phosphatase [Alkalicoccus halolimnae]
MIRIFFVCLGNICRSPMAEAVFRHKAEKRGIESRLLIESAGTGEWHVGHQPHEETLKTLRYNHIPAGNMVGKQLNETDVDADYIIAMDAANLGYINQMRGSHTGNEVFRLLDLLPDIPEDDVPDPYMTGNFEEVFYLIDQGCEALLDYIIAKERL